MHATDPSRLAFETADDMFSRSFSFAAEGGLRKSVTINRSGRQFTVETVFIDGAVTDAAVDRFEADGMVRISLTETGLYIASHRSLLADRVRLQRTRFF